MIKQKEHVDKFIKWYVGDKSKNNERINKTKLSDIIIDMFPTSFVGDNKKEKARSYVRNLLGANGNNNRKYAKMNVVDFSERTYDPKILILDIETSPQAALIFGLFNKYIGIEHTDEDWFMFSWAAKWIGDDKVFGDVLNSEEAVNQDDCRIAESLYNIVNDADIIVAHNADKFDIPRMKLRFLVNGFPPPLPFQVVDTLKVWKREFGSTSNRLDYLNRNVLKIEGKKETVGFNLWKRCYHGDADALRDMYEYNRQDVVALEENYLIIRSWIHSHPNLSLITHTDCCPNCGSKDYSETKSVYRTSVSEFIVHRCNNCDAIFRSRSNNISKDDNKKIITTTAR